MAYRVELAPSAQRDLKAVPRQLLPLLRQAILALAEEPRPRGARKVRGQERTWRIRVGRYRILYDVHDDRRLVVVLRVRRREEGTYRL